MTYLVRKPFVQKFAHSKQTAKYKKFNSARRAKVYAKSNGIGCVQIMLHARFKGQRLCPIYWPKMLPGKCT